MRFQARSKRYRPEKLRIGLGFLGEFPTQRNRELFLDNRDLFPQIREFTGWIREITNSPHTGGWSSMRATTGCCWRRAT